MEEKIKEVISSLRVLALNAGTLAAISTGAEQRTWNLMCDSLLVEIASLELAIGVTK